MSDALIEQTLRLYARYQREVVEALDLCPWAKRAREQRRVEPWVCLTDSADPAPVLAKIDEWCQHPQIEIGLVIFPRLRVSRKQLERYATDTMSADKARQPMRSPEFVLAAFHPNAELDDGTPQRLIPYWRRTPDPTFQVVRVTALERVRRGETTGTQFLDPKDLDLAALAKAASRVPVGTRVAQNNAQTLVREGKERIDHIIEDILLDHARTRRQLNESRLDTSQPSEAPARGE